MNIDRNKYKLFGLDLIGLFSSFFEGLNELFPNVGSRLFLKAAPQLKVLRKQQDVVFLYSKDGYYYKEIQRLSGEELAFTQKGIVQNALNGVSNKQYKRIHVSLLLTEQDVLRREISLPIIALGSLQKTIGYQVSRLTPFTADQLYYTASLVSKDSASGVAQVEFLAVLKAQVDPLIAQVENATGLTVNALTTQEHADLSDSEAPNLFGKARIGSDWLTRLNINSYLLVTLCVVIVMAISVPVIKKRNLLLQQKAQLSQVQSRISSAIESRNVLEQKLSTVEFIVAERNRYPSTLEILNELTEITPDNISLNLFEQNKDQILIQGNGKGIVEYIQVLNTSSLFTSAKLSSSLSRDVQSGKDRFSATMQLKMLEGALQ